MASVRPISGLIEKTLRDALGRGPRVTIYTTDGEKYKFDPAEWSFDFAGEDEYGFPLLLTVLRLTENKFQMHQILVRQICNIYQEA